MTSITLYEFAEEYLYDLQKLNECDIDDQTFEDTLEGLSGSFERKAINVAMYIKTLEANAIAIKNAEKAMSERRKCIELKQSRIEKYLIDNMLKTGLLKIDCPYFSIFTKKNPPAVEILNFDAIPSEYFDIPPPPPPSLNKMRLKDALKSGEIIEGARLTQGNNLQIK